MILDLFLFGRTLVRSNRVQVYAQIINCRFNSCKVKALSEIASFENQSFSFPSLNMERLLGATCSTV